MFLDIFTPHNCARLSVWKLISRAGKLIEYLFEFEHSFTILCVFFSFHTIVQGLACAIVWKLISRAGKLFEYLFTILCVFFSFHTIVQGLACAIVWVQMFWVVPSKLRRS